MAHVAAGVLHYAVTLALGAAILAGASSPRLWTAYGVLAVVGWLVLLVVGVMYKILPFLMWMNLFGPRAAQAGAPTQADLVAPRLVRLSLVLLAPGAWALAGGILAGRAVITVTGALLFLAGAATVVAQYVRILLLARPRPVSAP